MAKQTNSTTAAQPAQSAALPPQLALYHLGIGHYYSRALHVAAKLRLADLLADGPRTVDDLAAVSNTNAPALNRMLRLLAAVGVVEQLEPQKFALAPLGQPLRSDVPGSMRYSVMLFAGIGIQDGWKELEYCVRTGEPAFRRTAPDSDPFTEMGKDPEMAAIFDKAMATFAPQTAAGVAAAYDFSVFGTVADVGGGTGALLLGILAANPGVRGIVFDLPHVAEKARQQIAAAGMSERCDVMSGNFFEEVAEAAPTSTCSST